MVYRGTDNRVHEMFLGPAGWVHADLNALAGRGDDVRGAPMGYLSPSGARVIYRGDDNRVHSCSHPAGAGGWRFADLSRLAGTSAGVSGEPWGIVLFALLGAGTLAALVPAWRGNRPALITAVVLRVISALLAFVSFFAGAPVLVMAAEVVVIVATVVALALLRRRPAAALRA